MLCVCVSVSVYSPSIGERGAFAILPLRCIRNRMVLATLRRAFVLYKYTHIHYTHDVRWGASLALLAMHESSKEYIPYIRNYLYREDLCYGVYERTRGLGQCEFLGVICWLAEVINIIIITTTQILL